ncbi:MAG: c-type cytochrome domain-containing protein, partial [Planctomycetaceae bacterium]
MRVPPASGFAVASLLAGLVLPAGPATVFAADKPIRFDRDIRPLLSEHCFACHVPGKQEAELRLDDGAAATAALPTGARAVVPCDAAASAMLSRIRSTDPDLVMPPPHA